MVFIINFQGMKLLCKVRTAALCLVTQSRPTLCNHKDCSLPGSSVHGKFPGQNTRVSRHFLLQGIFLTQRSNLCLLHLLHWQDSLPLHHPGSLSRIIRNSISTFPSIFPRTTAGKHQFFDAQPVSGSALTETAHPGLAP